MSCNCKEKESCSGCPKEGSFLWAVKQMEGGKILYLESNPDVKYFIPSNESTICKYTNYSCNNINIIAVVGLKMVKATDWKAVHTEEDEE